MVKKTNIFFEIKWGTLNYREAGKLLHALSDKAKLVEWHVKGGDKREYYDIMAESIEAKEELRNQAFMVYDLEELKAFPILHQPQQKLSGVMCVGLTPVVCRRVMLENGDTRFLFYSR